MVVTFNETSEMDDGTRTAARSVAEVAALAILAVEREDEGRARAWGKTTER